LVKSFCSVVLGAELDERFQGVDPVFNLGPMLSGESLDLETLNF